MFHKTWPAMSALISHGVWFCCLVRLAVGVTLRNFGCDPSVYFGKFTFLQFGRESNKVGCVVRLALPLSRQVLLCKPDKFICPLAIGESCRNVGEQTVPSEETKTLLHLFKVSRRVRPDDLRMF